MALRHGIERGACLEPGDLVVVERLVHRELVGGAIRLLAHHCQWLARLEVREPLDAELVKGTNLRACTSGLVQVHMPYSKGLPLECAWCTATFSAHASSEAS